jgi:hydroxymethylglutaryl-CoA reductase
LDKVNNTVDVNIKRVSSAIENIAKNNSYQFENKANSMKVFSNAIDEKNFNVTVFDLMGRTIATAETQNGEILMDKTSWGSSLVIVQVKNNQNIINYKLATLN